MRLKLPFVIFVFLFTLFGKLPFWAYSLLLILTINAGAFLLEGRWSPIERIVFSCGFSIIAISTSIFLETLLGFIPTLILLGFIALVLIDLYLLKRVFEWKLVFSLHD